MIKNEKGINLISRPKQGSFARNKEEIQCLGISINGNGNPCDYFFSYLLLLLASLIKHTHIFYFQIC